MAIDKITIKGAKANNLQNINLEILDMSVFDKFTRFDRKDEISLKKTVFDEIRVKVSVDLA